MAVSERVKHSDIVITLNRRVVDSSKYRLVLGHDITLGEDTESELGLDYTDDVGVVSISSGECDSMTKAMVRLRDNAYLAGIDAVLLGESSFRKFKKNGNIIGEAYRLSPS